MATVNTAPPSIMLKLVTGGKGNPPVICTVPVPQPSEGELLVKVAAIAQNPADWRANDWQPAGVGLGVDFAGTVVSLGPGAPADLKAGDRVSGFVEGSWFQHDRGAMAEYLVTDASLVWRIPEGKSFEEASTMNCGLWTAIQALFHTPRLALPLRLEGASRDTAPWVLIYSGATSVGQFGIQLVRYAGYRVITTASPKNFDLVKTLGADLVVDYRDNDVAAKMREATNDSLKYAFDTIADEQTQQACVKAFGKDGGKLIVTSWVQDSAVCLRSDVQIQHTLLYTVFGKARQGDVLSLGQFFDDFATYPATPEDRRQAIDWMSNITELWQNGHIQPNQVQHWPGGLDAISDGIQHMKEGKVSAVKIVYTL